MRYKSFRIQNYKAIKDLTVQLDGQNLVPIIGLNETGKSSICLLYTSDAADE